jgi:diguanylate cyclase
VRKSAIPRAVLALGKSLAIPILAEGIETESQLQVLKREGCDEVQGFLLGRPGALGPDAETSLPEKLSA